MSVGAVLFWLFIGLPIVGSLVCTVLVVVAQVISVLFTGLGALFTGGKR